MIIWIFILFNANIKDNYRGDMKPNNLGGISFETRQEIEDGWQALGQVRNLKHEYWEGPVEDLSYLDLGRTSAETVLEAFERIAGDTNYPDSQLRSRVVLMMEKYQSMIAANKKGTAVLTVPGVADISIPESIAAASTRTKRAARRVVQFAFAAV